MRKFEERILQEIYTIITTKAKLNRMLFGLNDVERIFDTIVYMNNREEDETSIHIGNDIIPMEKYLIPSCLKELVMPSKVSDNASRYSIDYLDRYDDIRLNVIHYREFNNIIYNICTTLRIDESTLIPFKRENQLLANVLNRCVSDEGYVAEEAVMPIHVSHTGMREEYFRYCWEDCVLDYFNSKLK